MTQSEHSILVADILLAFGARPGLRLWRAPVGAARTSTGQVIKYGVKGQADISGVLAPLGRRVEIECKTGAAVPSGEQKAWRTMMQAHGAVHILARSVQDVEAVLGPLLTP